MTTQICLWIIILSPFVKFTISIAKEIYDPKEKEKSAGIVASIIVCCVTYFVYYQAGIFNLLK